MFLLNVTQNFLFPFHFTNLCISSIFGISIWKYYQLHGLWNLEVQYHIHKDSLIIPVVCQINPISHIDTYFLSVKFLHNYCSPFYRIFLWIASVSDSLHSCGNISILQLRKIRFCFPSRNLLLPAWNYSVVYDLRRKLYGF